MHVSLIIYCGLPTLFKEKNRYQSQLEQKACFCLITKMCTHCLANVALIMMGSAGLAQTQRHLCVASPGLHHSYLVFLKEQSWQLRLLGTLLCKAAMAQWQSDSLARLILHAKYYTLSQYFIAVQIIVITYFILAFNISLSFMYQSTKKNTLT